MTIDSPADGATLARGQNVNADYSCADEAGGSGPASCVGDVPDGSPIDTATLGAKSFDVTATDNAGNDFTRTVNYTVTDQTDPTATITTPQNNAAFERGQVVLADYDCADEANGSGLDTCVGTVPDGDPIDTSGSGQKSFSVTATDQAGNDFTRTFDYTISDKVKPTVTIDSPGSDASFVQGETVNADFACADDSGGSGIASCVGTTADGSPLDTSSPGSFELSVTATDRAGNTETKTAAYAVTPRPADPEPDPKPDDGTSKRPDTEITRFKVNPDRRKLVVGLASEPAGAAFECRMDDGEFAPCDSPATFRRLAAGEHVFKARALGPHGTPDHTPAKREFRIGR